MDLIDYIEFKFDYKKLRQTRKNKNLSIAEVSEKTGIPADYSKI